MSPHCKPFTANLHHSYTFPVYTLSLSGAEFLSLPGFQKTRSSQTAKNHPDTNLYNKGVSVNRNIVQPLLKIPGPVQPATTLHIT